MPLFGKRHAKPQDVEHVEVAKAPSPDAGDQMVLDQLRAQGVDLSRPQRVLHYVYTPTETVAREMGQAIGETFRVAPEIRPAATGSDWLILLSYESVITIDHINAVRQVLTQFAVIGKGEYDGWEVALPPPRGDA